jgi:hypothetical protein
MEQKRRKIESVNAILPVYDQATDWILITKIEQGKISVEGNSFGYIGTINYRSEYYHLVEKTDLSGDMDFALVSASEESLISSEEVEQNLFYEYLRSYVDLAETNISQWECSEDQGISNNDLQELVNAFVYPEIYGNPVDLLISFQGKGKGLSGEQVNKMCNCQVKGFSEVNLLVSMCMMGVQNPAYKISERRTKEFEKNNREGIKKGSLDNNQDVSLIRANDKFGH